MTLAELKERVQTIDPGGIVIPTDAQFGVHQRRVFAMLTAWCEPLNLLVAYDDRDIASIVDGVWRLKKPVIATDGAHYIDIDERLDEAFVYGTISVLSRKLANRLEWEQMAYKEALEYAVGVHTVGYDNAKRIYEQESFIDGVEFDCLGRVYKVRSSFVDAVIACILCGRACLSSAEASALEKYRAYIAGEVRPVDREKLLAVDKAVFHRLMNDPETMAKYDNAQLAQASTLFCEFSKLDQNEAAEAYAVEESKRMGWMECDKPTCKTNNRCEGM